MFVEELATDGYTALAGTLNQGARLRHLPEADVSVTLVVVIGQTSTMAGLVAFVDMLWASDDHDPSCPGGTGVSVSFDAPTVATATTTAASASGNDGSPLLYVARLCDAGVSSVTANTVAIVSGSPVMAWLWVIAEFAHLQSSILINVTTGRRMFLSFGSALVTWVIAVRMCRRRFICRVALAVVLAVVLPAAVVIRRRRSSDDESSNTKSRLQEVTLAVELWDVGSRQDTSS